MSKRVMVRIERELLDQLKQTFPEVKKLNYTQTTDVLLRRMLGEKQNERPA